MENNLKHTRPRTFEGFAQKFLALKKEGVNGCHIFLGGVQDKDGYSRIKYQFKTLRANRVAWRIETGQWPHPELKVCHTCDNPECVNPKHLFLGTALDNNLDKIRKGRDPSKTKKFCIRGHRFDEENTYIKPNGRRSCRACRRKNAN